MALAQEDGEIAEVETSPSRPRYLSSDGWDSYRRQVIVADGFQA
jgi:hypothetical protein